MEVEFHLWKRVVPTDLSTLMISSFVLGVILVFISTLARDTKRAIEGYQKFRQKKKGQSLKEELNRVWMTSSEGICPKLKHTSRRF